ncbi:MAG: hypothetical protein ACLGHT_09085, partial [Acidimicrobiia bacterium]
WLALAGSGPSSDLSKPRPTARRDQLGEPAGGPPIGAWSGVPVLRHRPHGFGRHTGSDAPAEVSGGPARCAAPPTDVLDVSERGLDASGRAQMLEELLRETLDANGLNVDYSHGGASVGCSVR